jgi:cephalosporin hydroxylase
MKIDIDTTKNSLTVHTASGASKLPLYSDEGFEILSDLWVKVGWNQKHPYTFTWWGRPIIQNPEDVLRMQEIVFRLRPDVVIETGVAHGGSLVFFATLFEAMGRGRVIGVDIEIRQHNLEALNNHPMKKRIDLVQGSSIDPTTVDRVRQLVPHGSTVMVVLDSNHTKDHVAKELDLYHSFVTKGSYIVATDGVMSLVSDVPRGTPAWRDDNPTEAARDFAANHPEFVWEQPAWLFNESTLNKNVTHWPGAWLKRL